MPTRNAPNNNNTSPVRADPGILTFLDGDDRVTGTQSNDDVWF